MSAREVSFDSGGCTLVGTYAQAASPMAAALLVRSADGKHAQESRPHPRSAADARSVSICG